MRTPMPPIVSPLLLASTKCKTALLTPASGDSLVLLEAYVNNLAAEGRVGVARLLNTSRWKVGFWDASASPKYIDDTTDAQDAGTNDVQLNTVSTNNDGFVVQSIDKFNIVGLTIGTAQNNGTLEYTYWNGSAWAALTLLDTPVLTSTGDTYLTFLSPVDWATGGDTGDGIDSGKYAIRVRATTAPSTTAAKADIFWVASFLSYQESLAAEGTHQFTPYNQQVILRGGESLLPYFETAGSTNSAQFHYYVVR